jgi:two-component system phosphate regulon sensor histidine kinase PhoR
LARASDESGGRSLSLRGAALRGALVASSLLIAIAALRHTLDVWLVAGVGLALLTSAVLIVEDARVRTQAAHRVGRVEGPLRHADALLAAIPDPVILVDRRAVVVEANPAAQALLPALKAQHPLSFALRSPDVLGGIEAALRTGQVQRVAYAERGPTERAFEVQIEALRLRDGEAQVPPSIVLFFRDQTSARRLEHMRVDFIANASHELRTPLASLAGFIETLQGPARNDPAARERFLEIMRGQAQRMTRLIDDLLSLSRIELRAHVPPDTVQDLALVTRHMVEVLSPMAKDRGVAVVLDIEEEPLPVLGDRDELLRVVENLVENAIKYGESGGRVTVSLGRTPARPGGLAVELVVRDDGPGIAPEHLPRLTERFYRADVAQSREKGGTGLGLAIVKHIVARHRGRLAIESELGHGATFRVSLPAAEAAPSSDVMQLS